MIEQYNTTLVIMGADMRNRNFEGRQGRYNAAGMRSFSLYLTDATDMKYRNKNTNEMRPVTLQELAEDGWNVKIKTNDDGVEYAYLNVAVSYRDPRRNPRITQSIYKGEAVKNTIITEETVANIDTADISNVSVELNPSFWGDARDQIKAYLNAMRYTLIPDIFSDDFDFGTDGDEDSGLPFEM